MEAFVISILLIVGSMLLMAQAVSRGAGSSAAALRSFGMFLLTKAPAGLVDLFPDRPGSGSKVWMTFGALWFVVASFIGFIATWLPFDPLAIAGLGIGPEDVAGAQDVARRMLIQGFLMTTLIGASLAAVARSNEGRLASEAAAGMFGFIWTGFTVATFILPALIGSELLTDVGFPLIGAAILAGVLIDVLITIGDRSSEHISVPSWFFLIALVAFISGSAVDALTNLSGATQAEWVGERVSTSWVLLAMMFGVAYHIAGSVVQRPLWSGSMTKASMVLLVVSIPPFLLAPLDAADVQEGSLLPSLAAILVTLGVLPLAAAGANLLATLRKDVGATSSDPAGLTIATAAVLMPLFAIGGMFMGTASMIGILGNSAHGAAASSIDDGFLWTVGGLICLGSFGYILPEISNRPLVDRNGLRWAVWLVAGGGIGMTVLSLMADFTTVAISGVNLDAALVTLAETDGFMLDDDATTDGLAAALGFSDPGALVGGFQLLAAVMMFGVSVGALFNLNAALQTMFAPTLTPTADQDAPIMDRYALAAGTTTSIRSLLALGLDPDAPIDAVVESSARGTSELKVRAPLHGEDAPIDVPDTEPVDLDRVDDVLVSLVNWLDERNMSPKEFFDNIDVDSSNDVSPFELREALAAMEVADLPPWDVDELTKSFDMDRDGSISLPELEITIMAIRRAVRAQDGDTDASSQSSEDGDDPTSEDGEYTWNEKVLMKIMAEHDIEDRDAFIEWAKGFDHDENKYLKTSEIQDAAQAWKDRDE